MTYDKEKEARKADVGGVLRRLFGQDNSLRQQMLRHLFGSIGIKGVSILIQFGIGVVLARMLGPKMLGVYAFAMASVQVLVIFTQFGFPAFLVRSIAGHKAKNAAADLKSDIIGASQIVLFLSGIAIVTFASILWFLKLPADGVMQEVLIVALVLIPLLALSATLCGAIQGMGHIVIGQFVGGLVRPAIFFVGLIVVFLVTDSISAKTALLAHALGAVGTLLFAFVILRQFLPGETKHSQTKVHYRHLLEQSFPFLLLAGAQVLNSQTDILMLTMLSTQDEVGLYRVALQIANVFMVILVTISIVIAPQIARLHANESWEQIRRILIHSHRAGVLMMIPLALLVLGWGADLLAFVFGVSYSPASDTLAIMVMGMIPYAAVGFTGVALSMLGKAGAAAILTLLTVVLNGLLNYLLISRYGIEGAAIATTVSRFTVAVGGILYINLIYQYDFSAIGWR